MAVERGLQGGISTLSIHLHTVCRFCYNTVRSLEGSRQWAGVKVHLIGGGNPRHFHSMNGIEIFIDESGDFGSFDERCPYYIVTMVFHESSRNLFGQIQELEYRLSMLGFDDHCIHSSPAVRGEEQYRGVGVGPRRKLLMNFLAFIHNSGLRYKCFLAAKRPGMEESELLESLHAAIDPFVDANYQRLASYGQITVAYDKGQKQISSLITDTLERRFDNVRVTKTLPIHSRLSQVADFACTMRRISHKLQTTGVLSRSELSFFGSEKNFRLFWLKSILKNEWK